MAPSCARMSSWPDSGWLARTSSSVPSKNPNEITSFPPPRPRCRSGAPLPAPFEKLKELAALPATR
jgi:hypothetical protein